MLKDIIAEVRCGHEGVPDDIVISEGVKMVKAEIVKGIDEALKVVREVME